MIGGAAFAGVDAPGGMDIIKSVTWQIQGAEKLQTYTLPVGSTTPLASPIVDGPWAGGISGTTKNFYWDDTPGNHTVTALVTYTDGSSPGSVSTTVSIGQPTVNSFNVTYTVPTWGAIVGQTHEGLSAHLTYSASVSEPAVFAGKFAIIQKVNGAFSVTGQTAAGVRVTHTQTSSGFVLDIVPTLSAPDGIFYGGASGIATVGAGQTASLFAGLSDDPKVTWGTAPDEVGVTNVTLDDQFIDYLVYQPAYGGIWVEVAETPAFAISASESWVGPFDNGNWELDQASTGGIAQGTPTLGFVSWTNFWTATDWSPPYPN